VRQTVVFDCSAESRNEMNLSSMLNIQGACLLAEHTEVRNIYGIWHEGRCIIIHKLANDLGNLLVYAISFDTRWDL